jgi:peptidyl-prolyl cis-trans isomerase C
VKIEADATEADKAAAKKKAEGLLAQIKEGADFAELAKANSDDTGSAEKGGDLGFFPKGMMVPPFEEAVGSMKPGDTSELVETLFGFHIIRLHEIKPGGSTTFEEIKERLVEHLKMQKSQEATQTYIENLKKEMNVKPLIS